MFIKFHPVIWLISIPPFGRKMTKSFRHLAEDKIHNAFFVANFKSVFVLFYSTKQQTNIKFPKKIIRLQFQTPLNRAMFATVKVMRALQNGV